MAVGPNSTLVISGKDVNAKKAATAVPVTVARGDGIGPEIMGASLKVLMAAGAHLNIEEIEIGERAFLRGQTSGMEPSAWESLRRTRLFYKAPTTTPQGGGFKSLNVTTRKTLGLFANVRPCRAYHPFVATRHPGMDLVIVRENEEDTSSGIEHQQTREVTQCLRLASRSGCERIIRYAFEYARRFGRRKVTCLTRDNIMKITDGLFHRVFDEVAPDYPEITAEHWIVDTGAARLADNPEQFDVLVLSNLYGGILSDVAAELAGSVGMSGSANVGPGGAMFEATHGSAPRRAGQDVANPSGLLLAGVMMLNHVGQAEVAARVHNAWLRTLEDGIHTYDMTHEGVTRQQVGTRAFAEAVIQRLGQTPVHLRPVCVHAGSELLAACAPRPRPRAVKGLVGVDVFLDWEESDRSPAVLGKLIEPMAGPAFTLKLISSRGVKVYPDGFPETLCGDHWRCRFLAATPGGQVTHEQIIALLERFRRAGFDFIKTEHLYTFDGRPGYALGQGE